MKDTEKNTIDLLEKYKVDFEGKTNKEKLKILKDIVFYIKVNLDYSELLLQDKKITVEEFLESRNSNLSDLYRINSIINITRDDIRMERKNGVSKFIKRKKYVKE